MKFLLMAQGFEVWNSMTTRSSEELKEFNTKAIKEILSCLPNSMKVKMEKCSSTKELWENL